MSRNKKKSRSYTSEFKEGAVKLALSAKSVADAAASLGVPEGTLHTWVHRAKKSGVFKISATDGVVNNVNVTQIINENTELKKRISCSGS